MGFTRAQVDQLLQPINPSRVLKDGKNNSHVSQQDVTAHLTRIFGFGSFDIDIEGPDLVFEQQRTNDQGKPTGRWDVCYRAKVTLTVRDPDGNVVCRLQGSATDTAENQKRGDAHDLALKSAESTAKKRAATNLGDQFGLSLYNKGQIKALVRGTLVMPEGEKASGDVQEGIEQQVSLGNDEIERDLDGSPPPAAPKQTDAPATAPTIPAQVAREPQAARWPDASNDAEALVSKALLAKLAGQFRALGVTDSDEGLMTIALLIDVKVNATRELTNAQAQTLTEALEPLTQADDPAAALTAALHEAMAKTAAESDDVIDGEIVNDPEEINEHAA
ncbi:Rad52/Rad22 family DNA repair protein [Streptosporangium sp. NPDC023963]|uniref:Rad52/Rad22 family DNA repair protein n=1 Tax=Streptosporangium sp. NPDC023963 TaxID=3155608 RepID=UPI00342E9517